MSNVLAPSGRFLRAPSSWVDVLESRARIHAEEPKFVFLGSGEVGGPKQEASFEALAARARAIAAELEARGAEGERVLLVHPPGLDFIGAFFGCLYAGAIAVPVVAPSASHPERTLPRLTSIAKDSGARFILSTRSLADAAQKLRDRSPELAPLEWLFGDEIDPSGAERWHRPRIDGDTIAFLQYTSGSTATPRGVIVTHRNLLENVARIEHAFRIDPSTRSVSWLPHYHDMGLIGCILTPIYSGVWTMLMSPIAFLQRPRRWLEAISSFRAEISGGPDFAYALCARKISPEQCRELDLSSWRLAFDGAEPVRHEVIDRFVERFAPIGFARSAFYPCYGLAESTLFVSGGITGEPPRSVPVDPRALEGGSFEPVATESPRTLVSCGRATAGHEIAIVDPKTRTRSVPGRIGEIWLRGPSVARGYWGNEVATEETFRARLFDGDGPFLRTGDLGVLHDGELFVAGRSKDVIIVHGRNHYPQDIESTVEAIAPAIRPSSVAAFSIEVGGEERLAIVAEIGRARGIDHDALFAEIRREVSRKHELIVEAGALVTTGTIPKTSSGKLQRRALRAMFIDGTLEAIYRWPKQQQAPSDRSGERAPAELRSTLRRAIAAVLEIGEDSIAGDVPLTDYGLDSINAVALAHALEKELGRPIDPVFVWQQGTLDLLASRLAMPEANAAPPERTTKHAYQRHARPKLADLLRAIAADVVYHRAEGDHLFYRDADGREVRVLDLVGGFGATLFGHNHPELVASLQRALTERLPFHAQASIRGKSGLVAERLSSLVGRTTGRRYVATLASSGAEAVEAAIKHAELAAWDRREAILEALRERLARIRTGLETNAIDPFDASKIDGLEEKVKSILGKPPVIFAVAGGFHGKTVGALRLTHNVEYRHPFKRLGSAVFLSKGDTRELEARIETATLFYPDVEIRGREVAFVESRFTNVIACFAEPIQGEGGIHELSAEYLRALRDAADRHGFPLVFDEIQCGMGRTGTFLASERSGVRADYYLFGKSLGGGLAKISALLVDEEKYLADFGYLHTSTFSEDDLSSSVALAALDLIERDGGRIMRDAEEKGAFLAERLRALAQKYPSVIREVRGRGLLLGIELVPQRRSPSNLLRMLAEQRMLGFFIAGHLLHEHRIRVAPGLSANCTIRIEPSAGIAFEELERFVGALDSVLDLLQRGAVYELCRFAVGRAREPAPSSAAPKKSAKRRGGAEATPVAFLVHFVGPDDLLRFEPGLIPIGREGSAEFLKKTKGLLEPVLWDRVEVRSRTGTTVDLAVIGVPFTAEQAITDLRLGRSKWALKSVKAGVALARALGCVTVGLGGYTSIVSNGGLDLADDQIGITNGNSLTAAVAVEAALEAAQRLDLPRRIGVVGATGNVGAMLAELAAPESEELLLFMRNEAARARLERLEGKLSARAVITSELDRLKRCSIILSATSSPIPLIRPEHLSDGEVVIADVAVPGDVAPSVREERPRALVFRGGRIRLPLGQDLGPLSGLDVPGQLYACMAETILLGLSGVRGNFSYGPLTIDRVRTIRALAKEHGFEVEQPALERRLPSAVNASR